MGADLVIPGLQTNIGVALLKMAAPPPDYCRSTKKGQTKKNNNSCCIINNIAYWFKFTNIVCLVP